VTSVTNHGWLPVFGDPDAPLWFRIHTRGRWLHWHRVRDSRSTAGKATIYPACGAKTVVLYMNEVNHLAYTYDRPRAALCARCKEIP